MASSKAKTAQRRRPASKSKDSVASGEEHIEAASPASIPPVAKPVAGVEEIEAIKRPASEQAKVFAADKATFFDKTMSQTVKIFDFSHKYLYMPLKIEESKFVVAKGPVWYLLISLHALRALYCPCILAVASSNSWAILNELQLFWLVGWGLVFNYTWALHYFLFIKSAEDSALLWNTMIQLKPVIRKIKLQQFFVPAFSYAQVVATVGITIFSALTPTLLTQMRFIVYYGGQNGYIENYWLYAALTAVAIAADAASFAVVGATGIYAAASSSYFLEIWNFLADALVKRMEQSSSSETRGNYHQLFSEMRHLVVFLRIFKVSNAQAIFVIKLAGFSVSIFGISSLFLLNLNSPVISMAVGYLGFLTLFGYPAMYAKAYAVSDNLQMFKSAGRLQHRLVVRDAAFRREIEAISTKGVWVGSFQTFERQSVPIFIDFVFNQVVSLVIAFG